MDSTLYLDKVGKVPFKSQARLDSTGLKLVFSDVQDSRCPSTVDCIWQGEAKVTLDVTLEDGSQERVILKETPLHLSVISPESIDTVGDYVIRLVSLLPYPDSVNIPKSKMVAELLISRVKHQEPVSKSDPFELVSASIDELLQLNTKVAYSGGCAKHKFWIEPGLAVYNTPDMAEITLHLFHEDNGDMCDAYIHEDRAFNLKDYIEEYVLVNEDFTVHLVNAYDQKTISISHPPEEDTLFGTIKGYTSLKSCDCMPMVITDPNTPPQQNCYTSYLSTSIAISEPSPVFDETLVIKTITSGKSGYFEVDLPVGEYSLFVKSDSGYECVNQSCADCPCGSVKVAQDSIIDTKLVVKECYAF